MMNASSRSPYSHAAPPMPIGACTAKRPPWAKEMNDHVVGTKPDRLRFSVWPRLETVLDPQECLFTGIALQHHAPAIQTCHSPRPLTAPGHTISDKRSFANLRCCYRVLALGSFRETRQSREGSHYPPPSMIRVPSLLDVMPVRVY